MQTFSRIIGIGAAAAMAFALTACGSSDDDETASMSTTTSSATSASASATPTTAVAAPPASASDQRECTAEDIGVSGGFGDAPQIAIPDDCAPPTELVVVDLIEGSGPGAKAGQSLTMNYELVTWSDQQKADSSFDRGKPFELTLGAGQVIEGWDQGLIGVKEGARRLLIVPPDLGYGAGGNGIAPNETLVFVTDAVAVG